MQVVDSRLLILKTHLACLYTLHLPTTGSGDCFATIPHEYNHHCDGKRLTPNTITYHKTRNPNPIPSHQHPRPNITRSHQHFWSSSHPISIPSTNDKMPSHHMVMASPRKNPTAAGFLMANHPTWCRGSIGLKIESLASAKNGVF